jgi:hypothetical protein
VTTDQEKNTMAQQYEVPALTRSEVDQQRSSNPRPADCPTCPGYPVPHWPTTVACRSSFRRDDQGVERLFRVHCTCDWCF